MNEETADEETEEETEEDRHEKDVSPPRKRVKRASDQKVTFYVNIQTAVNTVTKGRGGARKSNSSRIMQLGPFITTNPPSENFREFQDHIATTARCRSRQAIIQRGRL
ncbi:hypothetical protein PC9H_004421 [Pleurotus ostreatus]|uniref:Uncharacterized protein n=1 Tax=Pleurotus ostreatus TaxID=5322 RepID=A0A8H7A3A1_PLEOS|nr:uncharacterized protein PC9H_004421 [Pleurotus ostreatus]KAF7437579.1 hypothetical protein PC9H_004421 [Pleurotus ostreatus]